MESVGRCLESFTVDVGSNVQVNCFDTGGDGPPVVILHGLAGSAKEFFPTAQALPEFRTICVDLRGHGGSTRRPADLSREAFVADVVRVIEETVAGPVALAGQSMGGHTAMLVAAARPDLVSRLVLLEAGAGSGNAHKVRQWETSSVRGPCHSGTARRLAHFWVGVHWK